MIPGWADPVGLPADLTLFSLGAKLCLLFLGVRFSDGSGVGGAVVIIGDPFNVDSDSLDGVDSPDSSLTGEGGLERSSPVLAAKTFSSDRSGTISGGPADLLGRRPARVDLDTGEVGTGIAVMSEATDKRSIEPGTTCPSRLVPAALVLLAFDRLRGADDACPAELELETPLRWPFSSLSGLASRIKASRSMTAYFALRSAMR